MNERLRNNLKKIRILNELTQGDLEIRTGIHQSELSRIESGVRKANIEKKRKLALVLGITEKELFPEE